MKALLVLFSLMTLAGNLLAYGDDNTDAVVAGILGFSFLFMIAMFVLEIFFLLAQHNFAKTIATSNPELNTSPVWIWTQLIPLWSLIAIPVTLIKLNNQYQAFLIEKGLSPIELPFKIYWGWIWYGGMVLSIFIPIFGIVSLVGLIGFWIHLNDLTKKTRAMLAVSATEPQPAQNANVQ